MAFTTLEVLFGRPTTRPAPLPTSLTLIGLLLGAIREPIESSWGHVMVCCTVPSAHTLVRWEDENAFAPIVRPDLPHLWPTGSSRGGPHRLRPGTSPHALRIPPHGGHPALRLTERWLQVCLGCIQLSLSCPCRLLHTFLSPASEDYPRFWIRRPSSERRRDLNPPDHHAAQRTYGPVRLPRRPGLSLAGIRLAHAPPPGVSRVASFLLVQTCHRHYPGGIVVGIELLP